MGHLDGRMTEEDAPTSGAIAGVKDGPTGQKVEQAPSKDDGAEASLEKASDVLHGGDKHGGEDTPKPGA